MFELPVGSSAARGKPFINLLPLEANEKISAVLPVKDFAPGSYVFKATRLGTVKKTALEDYSNIRTNGIIAVDLRADDELVDVALTNGKNDILLFCDGGRVIRFNEDDVRAMGRQATGVRGMRLKDGEHLIALIVANGTVTTGSDKGGGDILTVSEFGMGMKTAACWFTNTWNVRSKALGEPVERLIRDVRAGPIMPLNALDTHRLLGETSLGIVADATRYHL